MALPLQQVFPAKLIEIAGKVTEDKDGNREITLIEDQVIELALRFALPRSSETGKGSTLSGCALNYVINSGGAGALTSAVPAITRYVHVNGVAESTTALTIDSTTPAFELDQTATTNRPVSSVSEDVDDQATTNSVSYLYTVTITAATDCSVIVQGVDVLYNQNGLGGDENALATISTDTTLDVDNSGLLHNIDSSGGAVTLTLPDVTDDEPAVFKVQCLTGGNAINISPDASDYINGLGLNDSTADKDYIFASPNPGDFIIIQSNGTAAAGGWWVHAGSGTITREP